MTHSHEDEDDFSSSDDDQDSSYSGSGASNSFSPTSSFSPLTPTSLHFPLSTIALSLPPVTQSSTNGPRGQISTSGSSQTLGRKQKRTDLSLPSTSLPRTAIPPGGVLPGSILEQGYNAVGEPRRPMNGFMIFSRWRRTELRGKHQELKTGEISSILSAEWKTMDKPSKDFYLGQATNLKTAFDARYPDYKYVRRPNGTRKKGSRGGKTYIPRARAKQQAILDAQQGSTSTSNSSALGLGGMSRWVQDDEDVDRNYQGDGGRGIGLPGQQGGVKINSQQPRRVLLVSSSRGRAPSGPSKDRITRRIISQPYPTPSDLYQPPHPIQRSPPSNISPATNSSAPHRVITIPSVPSLKQWSSAVPTPSLYSHPSVNYEQPRGIAEIRSLPSNRPSCAHPPSYPSTPMSSTFPPSSEPNVYSSESSPYPPPTSSLHTSQTSKGELPLEDFVRGWSPQQLILQQTIGLGLGPRVEEEIRNSMRGGPHWQEARSSRREAEWTRREGGGRRRVEEHRQPQPSQQPRWSPAPLQSPFLPAATSSSSSFGSAYLPHFHPNFGQSHSLAYNDVPLPADLSTSSPSPYDHSYPQHPANSYFSYLSQPPPFHPSSEHTSQQHVGGRDQFSYPRPPPPSRPSFSHPYSYPFLSREQQHPSSFSSYQSDNVLLGGPDEHVDALSTEIWTGGSNSPNGIEDLKFQGGFGSFPEGERWRV